MDKVAIIIPITDPSNLIDRCLLSVLCNTIDISLVDEIAIIDNSANGLWSAIAKFNQLLTVKGITLSYFRPNPALKPDKDFQHIRSCNIGLEMTTSPLVLFLNDDIVIPTTQQHWLGRLNDTLNEPDCGIATLTLLCADHTIYWIGVNPDWKKDRTKDHLLFRKAYDFIPKPIYETEWSNFACALIKRTTFKAVPYNGVKVDYLESMHYWGDNIFGCRIVKELGLKNLVCRDTWIYHINDRLMVPKRNPIPIQRQRMQLR